MIEHQIKKLENPERIRELNPTETLAKAGLKENMIVCDIGAGTGIFSLPAAKITNKEVYALEIADKMIDYLEEKKKKQKIDNLKIIKVQGDKLPLEDQSCHLAIMVTVYHEIENKIKMLEEIKRILKPQGSLLIVEFHKKTTKMGPPMEHRISENEVKDNLLITGFSLTKEILNEENFYGHLYTLMKKENTKCKHSL